MSDPRYGMRISWGDAIVLAAGVAATWVAQDSIGTYAWVFAVAVGHFFLFCNVFRVRRSYELIWALAFMVNFAAHVLLESFSWTQVLAIQAPLTVALILLEVRSPRYHGVGARQLNPALDAYLQARPLRRP